MGSGDSIIIVGSTQDGHLVSVDGNSGVELGQYYVLVFLTQVQEGEIKMFAIKQNTVVVLCAGKLACIKILDNSIHLLLARLGDDIIKVGVIACTFEISSFCLSDDYICYNTAEGIKMLKFFPYNCNSIVIVCF